MDFKDIVRIRRKELGLTLEEIGNSIGVSKATVQRYESGEIKNVGHAKISALSKILNISPSYLLGFSDDVKDDTSEIIDLIYSRPELSALLSIAKNSSKEEIEQLVNMLNTFKGNTN